MSEQQFNPVPPILETVSKVPSKEELRAKEKEERRGDEERRKARRAEAAKRERQEILDSTKNIASRAKRGARKVWGASWGAVSGAARGVLENTHNVYKETKKAGGLYMSVQKKDLEKMSQRRKISKEMRDVAREAKEKSEAIKGKRTSALEKIMKWSDETADGAFNAVGNVVKWPALVATAATLWPAGGILKLFGNLLFKPGMKSLRQIRDGDNVHEKPANDNKKPEGEKKKAA